MPIAKLQGERLQYVLLAGPKLQDDAAGDPLTAAKVSQASRLKGGGGGGGGDKSHFV